MPRSRQRKKKPRNIQVADEIVERDTKFGKVRTRSGNLVTIEHRAVAPRVDTLKGEWEKQAYQVWKAQPKPRPPRGPFITSWLDQHKPKPHVLRGADDGGEDQVKADGR